MYEHCKEKNESLASNAIRGLCIGNQLDQAQKILNEMRSSEKLRPRHRTYSPILNCASRLGNMNVVREIFEQMSQEYINRPNEEDLAGILQGA